MPVDASRPRRVAEPLLGWYDRQARVLPWRVPPGSSAQADPYRVWLSEVMLQQTTVTAVTPYYRRFLSRWPTVAALAAADEGELMAAWAGLGYYARARNLLACARAVVRDHGGVLPDTEEALARLPGIGRYTAAAIAAIAWGRRAVVVDGNVERVVSRLFAVAEPLPASRPRLRALTGAITPDERAGDFAQAMMDLGATTCTPRSPRCLLCPVNNACDARAAGEPERFPIKVPRAPKPQRRGIAYWLEADGRVLLQRRPERGLLGGMRALPGGEWGSEPAEAPPAPARWTTLGAVAHVFTHFALTLEVRGARLPSPPAAEGEWWPVARLADAGLPTLFARAAALGATLSDDTREAA